MVFLQGAFFQLTNKSFFLFFFFLCESQIFTVINQVLINEVLSNYYFLKICIFFTYSITPLLKALPIVKTYENFFSFFFDDTQWLSQEKKRERDK